jgi:hypothetical protein
MATKKKQTREQRLEAVLRKEIETAKGELEAASQQAATWSGRVSDLQAYIAEREAALKAD